MPMMSTVVARQSAAWGWRGLRSVLRRSWPWFGAAALDVEVVEAERGELGAHHGVVGAAVDP